ncbi:SDR family oxidoreductase [Candidatus Pelagibacter sp.]|nr:SDR family oxidoreductase [Candidatus Pelagibacter sp.]
MSIKINLKNKNVLITGANGSIGYEITTKFLLAGANCVCVDKNFEELKKLISKGNYSSQITLFKVDLNKKNLIKNFINKIKKRFKIHILINNAGYTSSKNFLSYNFKEWEKTLQINLTAPFLISQMISKYCMPSGGSIINITSLAAEQGFPNNVAYVASKGGLKQLTKAIAIDLSKKNIRVNSIGPGYVKTNMTKKSWNNSKKRKNRSERIISNRWAHPNDIANACLFLGSQLSSYINGQEIYVDGGWLSKGLKNEKG